MAQLFFKYGTKNSGKSIEILKVCYNYRQQNKPIILMTSGLDEREGIGNICSRIGLKEKAKPIFKKTNIFELVKSLKFKPFCVLVDEAQFLNKQHILDLTYIVDRLKIPVIAFGLKNDFRNIMFEGSKYLILYADKIDEIKTICWFCNKKAIMNLYYNNGNPIYEGVQLQLGGNELYYPVCRHHYFHPKIEIKENKNGL